MATTTRKTAAKKTTAARSATARAAKAPQDHKPKAELDEGSVTVEVRGEKWTVQKEVMDDFELLDDLNALDQRDDATRMPSVLRRFLGDEQFTKAMDVLRKESKVGRVTIEAGSEFVWDLMAALNPNSSRS
jgi:hypothetical protein